MERYYQPEIECASREQIRAWQDERLVKQVQHVWDNVPYYRHKMEDLKKGGKIVTSTQKINPMPVITGAAAYPDGLIEKMQAAGIDVDAIDALALAEEAGSAKAVNIVLMGRLSRWFDFSQEEWLQAIEQTVPAKFLELNKKAFMLGREA